MNGIAQMMDTFLEESFWLTSAVLLTGGLLSLLTVRRPARAHQTLVLAMIVCVALPLLREWVRVQGYGYLPPQISMVDEEAREDKASVTPTLLPTASADPATASGTPPSLEMRKIMVVSWVLLSGLVSIRLVMAMLAATKILSQARPLIDQDMQTMVEGVAESLGLSSVPTVFTSDLVRSPVMWGWRLHPALLLPAHTPEASTHRDWRAVVCHELAHAKRSDQVWGFFAELLVCILPWNPLAWWVQKRIGMTAELACDDWTLDRGHSAASFSETLLSFSPHRNTTLAPAALSSSKLIAVRIRRLLHQPQADPRGGRAWAGFTVALTVCLTLIAACTQAPEGESHFSAFPLANAGFEVGESTPAGWFRGAPIEGVEYGWSHAAAHTGKASLCIKKTAEKYFPVAQWSQAVRHVGSAQYLDVGAWVKAERAHKAILDVQFVDEEGDWRHEWAAYIGARDLNDPPAQHDWTHYSGTVAIPAGTVEIRIAPQIYGPGTVWFDDISARYQ